MPRLSAKAWKLLRPLAQTESVISHNSLNLSNTAIKLLKFQISNLRAHAQSLLWREYYIFLWSVTLWCGASHGDCTIKSLEIVQPPDALRYVCQRPVIVPVCIVHCVLKNGTSFWILKTKCCGAGWHRPFLDTFPSTSTVQAECFCKGSVQLTGRYGVKTQKTMISTAPAIKLIKIQTKFFN